MINKLPNLKLSELITSNGDVDNVKITTFASEESRDREILNIESKLLSEKEIIVDDISRQEKRLKFINDKLESINLIKK